MRVAFALEINLSALISSSECVGKTNKPSNLLFHWLFFADNVGLQTMATLSGFIFCCFCIRSRLKMLHCT